MSKKLKNSCIKKFSKFLWLLFEWLLLRWLLLTFNLNKSSLGQIVCLCNPYFLLIGCRQSVTKIMGKTTIWKILCFYSLSPLNNVEKQ